jgi:hypothetical protein
MTALLFINDKGLLFVIQRDSSGGNGTHPVRFKTGFFSRRARATLAVFTAVDSTTSGGP